jgi:uroporphyrinogen decarboxylase
MPDTTISVDGGYYVTEEMKHRERVAAVLRGEDVDRPPVSMWRHFFAHETSAEGLAEAMLGFQRRFDWDFMKINPRASYHMEDWGLQVSYERYGEPQTLGWPVGVPEDWLKLEVLDPEQGVLGEQLRAVEAISRGLGGEVPFLMTVFTPLSIASRLVSSEDAFMEHVQGYWDEVSYALDVIAETFVRFSRACLDRGASGLFYATTSWATTDRLTSEEYTRYARPHDLGLLEALPETEFTMLHVCKDNNLLRSLTDYPVQAFNWDARSPSNPSLAEGAAMVGTRTVVGGLDISSELISSSPVATAAEVRGMGLAMGCQGWMLGTGCTFSPEVPEANIEAVRRASKAT